MKFLELSGQYIKKNFLSLFLGAVAPAFLFAMLANPTGIISFYYNIFTDKIDLKTVVFIELLQYFVAIDIDNALLWLLGFLITALLAGVIYCMVQRKMQYGTFRGIKIAGTLKTCVLVVVPMILLVTAVLSLTSLIMTGLFFWAGRIFSGLPAKLICLVIGPVIWAVVFAYLTHLTCWLPCTMIDGLNLVDSISLSVRLCFDSQKAMLFTVYVALAFTEITLFLSFLFGGEIAFRICALIIAFMACMGVPTYINAVYFELAQMPRLDGRRRKN